MSLQRKLGINEYYCPLIDYPNYAVSNYGNVKNRNTNKILKPGINCHGYYIVNLMKGDIKFEEFQKMFYIAFCITVHKSQGSTFNHPYTIHQFELFDERLKHVALSRSTNKDLINIF